MKLFSKVLVVASILLSACYMPISEDPYPNARVVYVYVYSDANCFGYYGMYNCRQFVPIRVYPGRPFVVPPHRLPEPPHREVESPKPAPKPSK